jgi:hypothetical protein
MYLVGTGGSVVFKILCYKPYYVNELFFTIYLILPAAPGRVVHSSPNRNEYKKQKYNVSGE